MNRMYSQSGCCPRTNMPCDPRWPYLTFHVEDGGGNGGNQLRKLTFRLVNSATGIGLDGALFRLTRSGGVQMTATSNGQGMVEFSPLQSGDYQLTEEKAPDGYAPITMRYAVTVDAVGNVWVNGVLAQGFTIRNVQLPPRQQAPRASAAAASVAPLAVQKPRHTVDTVPTAAAAFPKQAAASEARPVKAPATGQAEVSAADERRAASSSGKASAKPDAIAAAPQVAEAVSVAKPDPTARVAPPTEETAVADSKQPSLALPDMEPAIDAAARTDAVTTGEWTSCGNRVVLVSNNSHTDNFGSEVVEVGIKYGIGDPDMEWHAMMNGPLGSPFDVYVPVSCNGLWYYAAFVKTASGDIHVGKTQSAYYP